LRPKAAFFLVKAPFGLALAGGGRAGGGRRAAGGPARRAGKAIVLFGLDRFLGWFVLILL